jgi:hypothetical protein
MRDGRLAAFRIKCCDLVRDLSACPVEKFADGRDARAEGRINRQALIVERASAGGRVDCCDTKRIGGALLLQETGERPADIPVTKERYSQMLRVAASF